MKTNITVASSHGFEAGQSIQISRPDRRWWMRFWRWITFRSAPMLTERARLTAVDGNTLTIQRAVDESAGPWGVGQATLRASEEREKNMKLRALLDKPV